MTKLSSMLVFVRNLLVVVLVGWGVWLRFWHLEALPPAFYHDEMDHAFTGQAVSLWGTDVTGTWSPWQFRPLKTLNYTSEWGPLFHGVTQRLFGAGVYQDRLTNSLFGLATVLSVGLFAYLLTNNSTVGLVSSLLMLVNPWHVHISRLGYEATISLFFLIVAMVGLWGIMKLKRHLLYFGIWLFGAFISYFTYHGSKFTIGAITLVYLLFILRDIIAGKTWKKLLLVISILGILTTLYIHTFIGSQNGLYGQRGTNDIFTLSKAQEMADLERRDRIPFIFDRLMANKLTTTLSELSNRYFFVFDPYRLWIEGVEGGYQFSLITNGYFGLLILLGLISHVVFNRKQKSFLLLAVLVLTSPIASVVGSGRQALLRSSLTYALLLLAAGWGLVSLYAYLSKKINSRLLVVAFLSIAGLEAIWFGANYFARYPLLAANNHYLNERLASRYLKSVNQEVTVVVERDPFSLARSYVFYNNLMSEITDEEKAQFENPGGSVFKIGQIIITTDCPKQMLADQIWMIDGGKWKGCKVDDLFTTIELKHKPRAGIPSPLDNGTYFTVWNDPVCLGKVKLQPYIKLTSLDDFRIEKMSDEVFCSKWVKNE